jgi:hypothetical protein
MKEALDSENVEIVDHLTIRVGGHAVALFVQALYYKPEGRELESLRDH